MSIIQIPILEIQRIWGAVGSPSHSSLSYFISKL